MLATLRSEYRKLLTIRSTYVILGLALLLLGFISYWVLGYRGENFGQFRLMESVMTMGQATSLFVTIIAVLLITHEYRYNTIMYTLTAANSRTKVLFAKLIVILSFTVTFTVLGALMAVGLTWLGTEVRGIEIAAQQFYYWDAAWRLLYYMCAYAVMGFLLGLLFRHVVGAIVTLFLVPTTVEPLLGLLLKDNTKYLPFSSLEQVMSGQMLTSSLTPTKAASLFTVYLVGTCIVAWVLYVRRDAN